MRQARAREGDARAVGMIDCGQETARLELGLQVHALVRAGGAGGVQQRGAIGDGLARQLERGGGSGKDMRVLALGQDHAACAVLAPVLEQAGICHARDLSQSMRERAAAATSAAVLPGL